MNVGEFDALNRAIKVVLAFSSATGDTAIATKNPLAAVLALAADPPLSPFTQKGASLAELIKVEILDAVKVARVQALEDAAKLCDVCEELYGKEYHGAMIRELAAKERGS